MSRSPGEEEEVVSWSEAVGAALLIERVVVAALDDVTRDGENPFVLVQESRETIWINPFDNFMIEM